MRVRFWLLLGLILLLAFSTSQVLADNGPHGGYTATTDACAGCHRAHTAVGPKLLVADTTLNLCYSCHGTSGTGADTNVEDGIYLNRDAVTEAPAEGTANRGLKAGGFVNALIDADYDGTAVSASVNSTHINDGSTGTAWGNGSIGSGAGAANFSLSCVSCHDPHGNASTTGGPTYRLLRAIPVNSGAAVGVNVTDEANKLYTVSDANNQYFGEGYPVSSSTWTAMDQQEREVSDWCAQCHTRYLADSGAGSTDSGDTIFAYRHMSQGSPGATCANCHIDYGSPPTLRTTVGPEWHHNVECMTCHVAHGSSASMSGFAGTVSWPDGATTPNGNARSSLLRGDGRGVCQRCHGK